jgi:hypothetical protein
MSLDEHSAGRHGACPDFCVCQDSCRSLQYSMKRVLHRGGLLLLLLACLDSNGRHTQEPS